MSRNYINRKQYHIRKKKQQDAIREKMKRSLILQFQNIVKGRETVDIETANQFLDLMLSNKNIFKPFKNWVKFIRVSKKKCQEFIYDAEYIIFKILGKRPYLENLTTDDKTFQRTREYYQDLEDYNGSIELVNKCSEWLKYTK